MCLPESFFYLGYILHTLNSADTPANMTILFALLLLFQSIPSPESLLDQQIDTYLDLVEQNENRSEALWSLIQIYRENETYREQLTNRAEERNIRWIDPLLKIENQTEGLHNLALRFGDEYLLLYLQLQIYPPEQRESYVDDFYRYHGDGELEELNRTLARTGTLPANSLMRENWDFSTFLLLFYSNQIDLFDQEMYSRMAEQLTEIRNSGLPDSRFDREFFFASLFRTHYRLDRFNRITSYYEQLRAMTRLPVTSTLRNLYMALDYSLYRAGHIDRSLEIQRLHTIPITEHLGQPEMLNQILSSHGGYLYTIGRFGEARQAFERALQDSSRNSAGIQTQLLNNLGLVYFKMGNVDRYIETQMRALDFAREQENYSHQLSIYRNLHIYYRKNQNRELAEEYIYQARSIAEESGNQEDLTSIIISMAVYYKTFLNDTKRAFDLLREAEELAADSGNYLTDARIMTEKADLLNQNEDYEESREIYEAVRQLGAKNGNNRMYLSALVDLAGVELRLDNLSKVEALIRELNAHDITVIDFPELVNARRIEADIALRRGRPDRAEELLSRIVTQVLERARSTTDIESGYWSVEPAYLQVFQLYSNLFLEKEDLYGLVNLLDQFKSINDAALIDNPVIQGNKLTEEELAENRRLTLRLDQLRKRYLVTEGDERLSLQNEIASLTARRNQLNRSTSHELFRPIALGEIQAGLRGDEMILHMTKILDRLYVLKIDRMQIVRTIHPISESDEKRFEQAIQGLSNGRPDLSELHEIYSWLQLDDIPSSVRSLIIIPDSYLYQIPLDVLPVSTPDSPISYGSTSYMVESFDIRYMNTLHDLTRTYPDPSFDYTFTGIGLSDFGHTGNERLLPLPGAVEEVKTIASQFSQNGAVQTLIEEQGTTTRFRESSANSRILHLASHSRISESDPLFSQIWLAPGTPGEGEQQNGLLYAWQLFNFDLKNELLMLNSCDSGSGEVFQGGGIMGFSRALRYAGARSLILNSWAVSDHQAADFAISFYQHLDDGKTKSEALKAAKTEMIRNGNANPHFWGAYILNGENRPLYRQVSPLAALLVVLFSFGLFLFLESTRYRCQSGRK